MAQLRSDPDADDARGNVAAVKERVEVRIGGAGNGICGSVLATIECFSVPNCTGRAGKKRNTNDGRSHGYDVSLGDKQGRMRGGWGRQRTQVVSGRRVVPLSLRQVRVEIKKRDDEVACWVIEATSYIVSVD